MRLTHNSLATMIAWVSTCLLAAGISTLFSDSTRQLWMLWGCFGLAAAVGLDVAARFRERLRADELKRIATNRYERELQMQAEENKAAASVREAVRCVLGDDGVKLGRNESRRRQDRVACDIDVELVFNRCPEHVDLEGERNAEIAQITNLSDQGFELTLREPLRPQRLTMIVASPDGERFTMLGEILWCSSAEEGGPIVAGGRFLKALAKASGSPPSRNTKWSSDEPIAGPTQAAAW